MVKTYCWAVLAVQGLEARTDKMHEVISKPLYQVLTDLTQEPRWEVALLLAIKDWIRLKLKETREQQARFEQRYAMDWATFKRAWEAGKIADKHSFEVERDYWEWEAAVTDEARLNQMLERLL